MAIKKVQLPDNSTQDINDARIASTDITQWNGKEDTANKVTSLSASSTDTEYPSAKTVYDALQNVGGGGESVVNVTTAASNISAQVGTLYQWTVVPTSISLSLPSAPTDTSQRIRLKFTTGGTAPSLSLPQNIAWEDDTPVVLANDSIYEILISYDTVGGWLASAKKYVASYIILPTGYTLYNWIGKDSGTAYIDTGYVPKTKPIVITEVMNTGDTYDADLFGFNNNQNNAYFVFNPGSSSASSESIALFYKYGNMAAGTVPGGIPHTLNQWMTIEASDSITVGGTTNSWASSWDFSNNTSSLRIFGARNNNCKNFRFKRFKLYDGTDLVRDLVPCTNANDEPGMFDLVGQTFYGSAVSGQVLNVG